MAKCSGSCSSFTPSSSTAWFKVAEAGEKQSGTPNTWAQADLTTGAPANVTLPSDLAPGNYLIRHEIIALQNAQNKGGAEFYPSCLQMTVSGNGSGTAETMVHFPGAYSATDPGLLGNVSLPFLFLDSGLFNKTICSSITQELFIHSPEVQLRSWEAVAHRHHPLLRVRLHQLRSYQ